MVIAYTKQEVKIWRSNYQKSSIGFVPTMGALHKGHLALVEEAKKESDLVAVSIFVNPLQFNNPADFEKYPNTLVADIQLLETAGVDLLFVPNAAEMYSSTATLSLDFGNLNQVMEGPNRPGHFSGVGLVVGKLFNIVQPHKAFFGLKDLQQVRVIQRLVTDLDMPPTIIPCPTIRESNGLALSSRNARLTESQREQASVIYQTLTNIVTSIKEGTSISEAIAMAKSVLENNKELITKTEYLEVVNAHTLQPISKAEDDVELAVCIACFIDEVRLIDNLIFMV
jgi:pantoate--beta-alanine ligase